MHRPPKRPIDVGAGAARLGPMRIASAEVGHHGGEVIEVAEGLIGGV